MVQSTRGLQDLFLPGYPQTRTWDPFPVLLLQLTRLTSEFWWVGMSRQLIFSAAPTL